MSNNQFDDIRPYEDSEVRYLQRCSALWIATSSVCCVPMSILDITLRISRR